MPILFLFILFSSLSAEETCHRCEVIREYNKSHPENNYAYYDDYIKAQAEKQEKKETQKDNAASDSKK